MAAGSVELAEQWTIVDDLPVFSRISVGATPDSAMPLIHVHGFGISGSYLLPTAKLLATDYPTYVPDLPGYGRSMKPKKTLSIPELGHAMASYMDAMGIEKANFIGNSMGCLIIVEFAHAYPDRIGKAILVSPAGGPHNQPIYRGLPQLVRDSVREPLRMYRVAVPDYLRFGLVNCFRLFHAMVHFPTIERLIELEIPTLIVVGVKDPLISKERITSALDVLPNLTLVFHKGAAHAVNYSHPEELASVVRDFIEGKPIDIEQAGDAIVVVGVGSQAEQAV